MVVISVWQSEQDRKPNMPILLQNQSGTLTKEFGFFFCVRICILPQACWAVSGPDGAVLLSLSLFRPISVRLRVFNWSQDPSVSRSPVLPQLFRPATVMNIRVEVGERSLQLQRQLTKKQIRCGCVCFLSLSPNISLAMPSPLRHNIFDMAFSSEMETNTLPQLFYVERSGYITDA